MEIFTVVDGKIVLNPNCLLIPELKAINEAYEDPLPAYAYVNYMTHPDSPYHNLPIDKKQQVVSDDVGGDFGLEDPEIESAIAKLDELYFTPVQDYYEGQKNAMHVVGRYLKNLKESALLAGREGNLGQIISMQKEAGKTMDSFLKLEKLWKEQVQQKLRGNAELGEY
jgi:hypothetical protein